MEQDWSDDEEQAGDVYLFDRADKMLVRFAATLMERAVAVPTVPWAKRATIAKLMHVFSRLPYRSQDLNVCTTISSPRKRYGDAEIYFYLSIGVESDQLAIRYGGYYYHPRSGGDSFTVFTWRADPGCDAEQVSHLADLRVVTALVNPLDVMRRMGETLNECSISIDDDDNELVGDDEIEDEPRTLDPQYDEAEEEPETDSDRDDDTDDDGQRPPLKIQPVTAADRELLQRVGAAQLASTHTGDYAYGISRCDHCGCALNSVGLFVDGATRDGSWGNYCANCCLQYGVGVGWGKGQLYARQPDNKWVLVAGFRR